MNPKHRPGADVYEDAITELNTPRMYAVVIFNDDFTSMDFVVELLTKLFHKTTTDAAAIMMQVHKDGKGVAGVFTYDIAITKKILADQMAAERGFPLRTEVE